jgi:hypothetical protein
VNWIDLALVNTEMILLALDWLLNWWPLEKGSALRSYRQLTKPSGVLTQETNDVVCVCVLM